MIAPDGHVPYCTPTRPCPRRWHRYILRAFLFALCLAVFYGFSAVGGLILIFPAVLYGTKAASTAIMCIHMWAVYKKSSDQEKPFRLQVELM